MKNIFGKLSRFLQWQPFTFRSVASTLICYTAITLYSTPNSDLVVDVMAKSILFLITIALISSVLFRINLKNKIKIECNFDQKNNFSRNPISSSIIISNFSIPPFFTLEIRRVFDQPSIVSPIHIIRGNFLKETKYLIDSVETKHRGIWKLTKLQLTFTDNFGFTSYTWLQEIDSYLEVNVRNIDIAPLPVIASSSSSGDEISLNKDTTGDLFDLKPYDPSDGTKRILWKTYAKSGQLISRKPEPASIPEGEVAIYLIASKEEDYVAAAAQSYVEQLSEKNIIILFGTDGYTSNHGTLYTSEKQEIYKAIISTVWHPDNGSGNGMSSYIKSLIANSKFLQNIIVFGPDDSEKIKLISKTVSSFQLKSYIVPVPSSFNNLAFNQSKDSKLFDFLTKKFLKSKNVLPSQSYYSTANSDYEIIQPQRRF